jgi:DNA topoisomerase-3
MKGTDGLPLVRKGDAVQFVDGTVDQKATKPPPRFTASTLLAAMKEIYKYVKDDSLKKKLKEVQGIGTEATRASIIDELIKRKFLIEEGKKKYLVPTPNAYMLVDALPDEMVYPDETAIWEERLHLMSEGKDELDSFLQDQIEFMKKLVAAATNTVISQNGDEASTARRCPQCGKGILVLRHGKYGDFYGCSDYPHCRYTEQPGKSERAPLTEEQKQYKCPRCQDGYFIYRDGPYGTYWLCSNAPDCNTRCSDVDGKPSLFAK